MNIAKHRKQAGLTQPELGRLLGISQRRTIGAWENNPDKVSLGNLKAYAKACGVTVADLLGYDGAAIGKLDKIREIVE